MERPLVTIAVITYNQERYVAEALDGCFAQTYSPLEILVSDDCSSDGTVGIVERKIAEYKLRDGRHKVVFHRNNKNLGILRNFEQCFELMHGELLIHNGGDDVSYPDRADKIVDAWLKFSKRPKFIAHAYDRMDTDGNLLPSVCRCESTSPQEIDLIFRLGACVAYSRDVCEKFPKAFERTSEDWVMESRAYLLGKALDMPDILSCYRIGSGLSTKSFRESRIGTADRLQIASKVIKRDIASALGWLPEGRGDMVWREIEKRIKIREDWRHLLTGKTYKERKAAYYAGARLCLPFNAPECFRRVLLAPAWIADPLIGFVTMLVLYWWRMQGRSVRRGR